MLVRTLLLLVLLGCERSTPVRAAPEGKADAAEVAEVAPKPVDATPEAGSLPPVEDGCKLDTDCDWLALSLTGEWTCCGGCTPTVGNKAWVARVKVECAALPPRPCPPLACPMAIPKPKCEAGRCVPGY